MAKKTHAQKNKAPEHNKTQLQQQQKQQWKAIHGIVFCKRWCKWDCFFFFFSERGLSYFQLAPFLVMLIFFSNCKRCKFSIHSKGEAVDLFFHAQSNTLQNFPYPSFSLWERQWISDTSKRPCVVALYPTVPVALMSQRQ